MIGQWNSAGHIGGVWDYNLDEMDGGQPGGANAMIPPPPGGALSTGAASTRPQGSGTGQNGGGGGGANSMQLIAFNSPAPSQPASAPAPQPPPPPLAPQIDRTTLDLLVSAVSDPASKQLAIKAITLATVARLVDVLAGTYGQGEYGGAWRPKLQLRMTAHVVMACSVGAAGHRIAARTYASMDDVELDDANDQMFDILRMLDAAKCTATLQHFGELTSGRKAKRDASATLIADGFSTSADQEKIDAGKMVSNNLVERDLAGSTVVSTLAQAKTRSTAADQYHFVVQSSLVLRVLVLVSIKSSLKVDGADDVRQLTAGLHQRLHTYLVSVCRSCLRSGHPLLELCSTAMCTCPRAGCVLLSGT